MGAIDFKANIAEIRRLVRAHGALLRQTTGGEWAKNG
jgi:hypothetical protein